MAQKFLNGIDVTGDASVTGKISGGEIEGTSLDINGGADISGAMAVADINMPGANTLRHGSYFELSLGASNTAQLTFNADYDGAQTGTYTPGYSGTAGSGMSIIKMPSGGVGGLDFFIKKHGTTAGSQNISTFTKLLQLHQDGKLIINGDFKVSNFGAGLLKSDANGDITIDTTAYSGYNFGASDLTFQGADPGDLVWKDAEGTEVHRIWSGSNDYLTYRNDAGTTYELLSAGSDSYNNANWDTAYTWGNHASTYSLLNHNHNDDYLKTGTAGASDFIRLGYGYGIDPNTNANAGMTRYHKLAEITVANYTDYNFNFHWSTRYATGKAGIHVHSDNDTNCDILGAWYNDHNPSRNWSQEGWVKYIVDGSTVTLWVKTVAWTMFRYRLTPSITEGAPATVTIYDENTTTDQATEPTGLTDFTNNSHEDAGYSTATGVADNAEVNVQSDWNATSGDALILNKPTIPTDYVSKANGGTFDGNIDLDASFKWAKNETNSYTYSAADASGMYIERFSTAGTGSQLADMRFQARDNNTGTYNSIRIKGSDNSVVITSPNTIISGNLTVNGTQTILKTATVEVEDNILQLNTTQGTPDTATATTSGISIYRGDGVTQASLIFDDGDDVWDLTNKLKVASNIYSGGNVFQIEGVNPYIQGTGGGSMRIKHTAGQVMYVRPDETGSVSFFEGANSQPVYFMTQTPTVNDTTNESAQLKFHTRSKQSDGNAVSKYATIKHLTHSIGYNYTTLDFAGSDKSKFNMPLEAAGGLYYTGDTHMGFIPHPRGAQFRSDDSSHDGHILIKIPIDVGSQPDDMISFYVDIYDYTTNEMISVLIGGYIYTTQATASSYWYNCTAIVNTKLATKDFTVRFGNDGTNFYVAIGETNSVWSYPSIVVRDFQCSYRGNVENYIDGWGVSISTTALTGVDETQTGNLPVASSALSWETSRTITLSGDLNGSVSIDGSANATLSAQVVNDSHTHDGRYYTETESDARYLTSTPSVDTHFSPKNMAFAYGLIDNHKSRVLDYGGTYFPSGAAANIARHKQLDTLSSMRLMIMPTNTFAVKGSDSNSFIKPIKPVSYGTQSDVDFKLDRNSIASYTNEEGIIKTAAIDTLRIDYSNNSEGEILIEPYRLNLATKSENMAGNSHVRGSSSNNQITGPDGELSASETVVNSESGTHAVYRTEGSVVTSGQKYYMSAYVKKGTTRYIRLNEGYGGAIRTFDFDNGNWSGSGSGTNYIGDSTCINEYCGNGWYRIGFQFSGHSSGNLQWVVWIDNNSGSTSYAGAGESVHVWGVQVEAGNSTVDARFATSYIKTTDSAVSRDRDYFSHTTLDNKIFSSEESQAGIFIDYDYKREGDSDGIRFYDTGSATPRVYFYQGYAGVSDSWNDGYSYVQLNRNKLAVMFKTSTTAASSFNGSNVNQHVGTTAEASTQPMDNFFMDGNQNLVRIRELSFFINLPEIKLKELTTL